MKKLTAEELKSLNYGDSVWFVDSSMQFRRYRYVGRMPSSESYLIFSAGEDLKSLYINPKGEFYGEWFSGVYNQKFVLQYKLEKVEKELTDIKLQLAEISLKEQEH